MKKLMIDMLFGFLTFTGWSCFAFVAAFLAGTGFFAAKNAYDLSGSVAQIEYENNTCFVAKGNMECFKND
ncbi:hypothetical protein [Flyfo podovirus Tbat2_2]|nr:hypothetical protein [Flyfo podovirus Tbat2_2]